MVLPIYEAYVLSSNTNSEVIGRFLQVATEIQSLSAFNVNTPHRLRCPRQRHMNAWPPSFSRMTLRVLVQPCLSGVASRTLTPRVSISCCERAPRIPDTWRSPSIFLNSRWVARPNTPTQLPLVLELNQPLLPRTCEAMPVSQDEVFCFGSHRSISPFEYHCSTLATSLTAFVHGLQQSRCLDFHYRLYSHRHTAKHAQEQIHTGLLSMTPIATQRPPSSPYTRTSSTFKVSV